MFARFSAALVLVVATGVMTLMAIAGAAEEALPEQLGPGPGDVFREYRWTNTEGDAGGSLRVGGRLDYGGGAISLPHELDLTAAIAAEVVLEKLLCHDGTRGLAISVNQHEWIPVPEAAGIAVPQWNYQHHIYPVVRVPLGQLKEGKGNEFRLKVDESPPQWPQNLIYGVHFRIYYDPAQKVHRGGRMLLPQTGSALPTDAQLRVEMAEGTTAIDRVDYVACCEDVNLEGDGQYWRWHDHYEGGRFVSSAGSATGAPWEVTWDTSWLPDQPQPFKLAAIIRDTSGLSFFTEPAEGLTLHRPGISVELCKPYDLPAKWVTRVGEKTEKFNVRGDVKQATAAQLVWVSWSPGYLHGIRINGEQVFEREGPRYAYFSHRIPLSNLSVLRSGTNELTTALTPKYDGKMVHGTEINWPGIMVLIRYGTP